MEYWVVRLLKVKTHIIHDCYYKLGKLANKVLFEYIKIYFNYIRRHFVNGKGERQNNMNNNFTKNKTTK